MLICCQAPGGAAEADGLHRPHAAHPGEVEALGGDHRQAGDRGEGDGDDEVGEVRPAGAVEPVGEGERNHGCLLLTPAYECR